MKNGLMIYFSTGTDKMAVTYRQKMLVRAAILATLAYEGYGQSCEVSVTFTDNEYIHKLNLAHRGVDRHTDVLSFPMYEREEIDSYVGDGYIELGDIVLSLERAKEQALEVGNTFLEEVAFLTVHSMLHLLGYDHERSKEDDEEQCRIQKEIVSILEI